MKKQMVVCLAAAAVMMLVTGCGTKEDRTTLHIKDGGKVVENITEDFNQDNYDEKELKTFIEQQIEDYKKESVLGPLFKLLEASFELIVPLVMAAIIDHGVADGDKPYIMKMCLVLVLLAVIGLSLIHI